MTDITYDAPKATLTVKDQYATWVYAGVTAAQYKQVCAGVGYAKLGLRLVGKQTTGAGLIGGKAQPTGEK